MLKKNINSLKIFKNSFLNRSEVNRIMNEIYNEMLKLKKKKIQNINFLKSRKKFDKEYFILKKNDKNWKNFYNNLKNFSSHKKIIFPKIKKFIKKKINIKFKIINSQFRIIEKSDKRTYPIHQELLKGTKNLLVFWIALHKIQKKEGGLMVYSKVLNKELRHSYNSINYPYLAKQSKIKNDCFEKSFEAGEALILGQYIPHGTAPKLKGLPRWAAIVRISI